MLDATGQPTSGAAMTLSMRWRILETSTGTDGVAHFGPLPPGVAEVVVRSGGTAFTSLALREGERTRGVVQLQPSCSLRGDVIDATTREPLVDAGVSLLGLVDQATILSTRTDARGEFEFTVRTSATFVARATVAGFVDDTLGAPPGCSTLHFELVAGAPQLLQIVDINGRTLPNAEVKLRPARWTSADWLFTGRADATGRYETPPLTLNVPWFAEATLAGETTTTEWTPLSDGGVTGATLLFDRESRRVSGRVVDEETGAPLPGADVAHTTTARDGTFALVLFGRGTQSRKVWTDGYLVGRVTSKIEGEDVAVRLERSEWVTGKVVDEKGRPIPRFAVDGFEYVNASGTFLSSMPKSTVEFTAWGFEPLNRAFDGHDLGIVQLRRATPLVVHVLAPDGGPMAAEVNGADAPPESAIASLRSNELTALGSSDESGVARIFTPPGQCVLAARFPFVPSDCVHPDGGEVTVQLSEAGRIEGVMLGRGRVLGEQRVQLVDGEAATFAAEGSFRLWPVAAGHHTLRARMPSGAIWQREVDVDAGATTEIVVSEDEGAQLAVEVETNLIGLVWVTIAQGSDRFERGGYTDPETRTLKLEFHGLHEGQAEITVNQYDDTQTSRVFLSSTPHSAKFRLNP